MTESGERLAVIESTIKDFRHDLRDVKDSLSGEIKCVQGKLRDAELKLAKLEVRSALIGGFGAALVSGVALLIQMLNK